MRGRLAFAIAVVCLFATSASAQTATATGVGVGISSSSSRSGAVAVGGGLGVGTGGTGGTSSAAVNIAGAPASTSSNINESGTTTVKNVPSVFAPGLAAAGLETCLGSISGGGAVAGFGASFGTTIPDPGCAARLDARTLWAMGLKRAAIARLCLQGEIYRSMPEVCSRYLPQVGPNGVLLAQAPETGLAPAAYAGGPIEVIEQRTGKRRVCGDYDMTRHRCRSWSHDQIAAAH